jgi:hypothetical protein
LDSKTKVNAILTAMIKLFLAAEFHDPEKLTQTLRTSLLSLLNHPNLITCVDIVCATKDDGENDYAVWEHCDAGTLHNLLEVQDGRHGDKVEIPEELCWRVLSGVTDALNWLHHGTKNSFLFERDMYHDEDWQPVLIGTITPKNSTTPPPLYSETSKLTL